MKRVIAVIGVLLLLVTVAEAKIKLVEAKVEPAAATVGEQVVGHVEFTGKAKNVSKVLIIPREYAYEIDSPFQMVKDESTKKNVWKLETRVPYDAPSGKIHLEIKALDNDGEEIVIEEYESQVHGKAGVVEFEIK